MARYIRNRSKRRHEADGKSIIWKPHQDWRVWVALLLMLGAILTYVLTLDDSIIPR
ncbi:MAG TPA: hypothetical protein VF452_00020 [Candidatus Binatia bacterium]